MYFSYPIKRIFEKIVKLLKDEEVLIVSHKDADGFSSYALLNLSFYKPDVLFISQLTPDVINNIPRDYTSYLFVDIGNNFEKEIFSILNKNKVIILDHHPTKYQKILWSREHINLNATLLGMDGSKEISASGLAYILSKFMRYYSLEGYYYLGFAGAFSDMQIQEEVNGFNKYLLYHGFAIGEITKERTIVLPGLNIKPLYTSIELFFNERGINFSSRDALIMLKDIGIVPYKVDMFRRVPLRGNELSEEDRRVLATRLAMELYERGIREDILQDTYIIKNKYLIGEFVTLLNAAVKLNYIKQGLDLAYGLKDIYFIYDKYRKEIGRAYNLAYHNLNIKKNLVYFVFNSKELKDSSMTGSIATMINRRVPQEIVVVGYEYEDIIKFSIRSKNKDIQRIIFDFCTKKEGCYGNGHKYAAGGVIKKRDFFQMIDTLISL